MPAPYGCLPSHDADGGGSHLDHYGCGYLLTLLGCHLFGFAPLKHLRENIRKLRDRERRSLFHNQSPIFDFPSGVLLRVHGRKLHDPAGPRKGIGFSGRGHSTPMRISPHSTLPRSVHWYRSPLASSSRRHPTRRSCHWRKTCRDARAGKPPRRRRDNVPHS